jgi:outer membrane lipoprotein-sorting protein
MLNKLIKPSLLFVVFIAASNLTFAQPNAKTLISGINSKFAKVTDYSASVQMLFNIPSIKLSNISGNVFYKKPNKFRLKAKGLFFMPKQNPLQDINKLLLDTNSYTAITNGRELQNGAMCTIVNIIPKKSIGDLVMGKFWIDEKKVLILKSEITTKANGTLTTLSKYGNLASYALPDEITLVMDVNKFKIPKMLAMDINKKKKTDGTLAKTEAANIKLVFANYKVNGALSDTVFVGE